MTDAGVSAMGKAHTTEPREQGPAADRPVDKPVDGEEASLDERQANGTLEGHVARRLGDAKPVEVVSVPETPMNGTTPAGGTPRRVLPAAAEPAPPAAEPAPEPVIEPIVKTGGGQALTDEDGDGSEASPPKASVIANASTEPAAKDPAAVNGKMDTDQADVEPDAREPPKPAGANDAAAGDKRKLAQTVVGATAKPLADDGPSPQNAVPLDKKPEVKVNETDAQPAADDAAATAARPPPAWPKAAKAKKEKRMPAVGRTARKTRSQGPVDV